MVLFKADSYDGRPMIGDDARILFKKQRLELEQQAAFKQACLARRGCCSDGTRVDPVLAAHLGLNEEGR